MKNWWFIFLLLQSFSAFGIDLKIEVQNIKSNQGAIKIALFPEGSDFPNDYNSAQESAVVYVENLKAHYTFENLKSGIYAIALFHDLNQNDNLDTNFAGIPLEPFGLSNNPRLFGKPTFKKCKFELNQDQMITIQLKKIF